LILGERYLLWGKALPAGLSCSLQWFHEQFRFGFSDGKNMGPLKKRVDHLKELVPEASDDNVLVQSTKHKN
jgi:hypothetical protein